MKSVESWAKTKSMAVFSINCSKELIKAVDRLVGLGYIASRSEFIRVAMADYLTKLEGVKKLCNDIEKANENQVGQIMQNIVIEGRVRRCVSAEQWLAEHDGSWNDKKS